jgi:hypothetical protein
VIPPLSSPVKINRSRPLYDIHSCAILRNYSKILLEKYHRM